MIAEIDFIWFWDNLKNSLPPAAIIAAVITIIYAKWQKQKKLKNLAFAMYK